MNPKWIFLIGQRGVGKTSLMKRLRVPLKGKCIALDLDEEIQRRCGIPTEMIFEKEGETGFRVRERETFEALIQETQLPAQGVPGNVPLLLVLGAGFEADAHPVFRDPATRVVWVRRPSDERGRIFLDRPRLNPGMPPLEEYTSRAAFRARRYDRLATQVYWMEEGVGVYSEEADSSEIQWFERLLEGSKAHPAKRFEKGSSWAVETLQSVDRLESLESRVRQMRDGGVDAVELRTDLLPCIAAASAAERATLGSSLADENIIWSWRTQDAVQSVGASEIPKTWIQDWAMELGTLPEGRCVQVLSLHDRWKTAEGGEETLREALERLETEAIRSRTLGNASLIAKASPLVRSFEELKQGYEWWKENPALRVFLPRTDDAWVSGGEGLWKFYRLWLSGLQRLEFVRGRAASAPDQPTLSERARVRFAGRKFGAVLGDPVAQSHGPSLHRSYFQGLEREYFAIRIPERWEPAGFRSALRVLGELGLQCASVTAPWKQAAWDLLVEFGGGEQAATLRSQRVRSINTLFYTGRGWLGDNTDLPGFRGAARELARRMGLREHRGLEEVAVWGGGGTLGMVREEFPAASFFSARTGEFRGAKPALYDSAEEFRPRVLIWALGRNRLNEGAKWPYRSWHPEWIMDLNYSEDSPGREAAQRMGARYFSGQTLFKMQAFEQQVFWRDQFRSLKELENQNDEGLKGKSGVR